MSEVEKQESQKTVVAFITGLLIGGLLVWVFSATPDSKKEAEVTNTTDSTSEEAANIEGNANIADATAQTNTTAANDTIGDGSITVADQTAGKMVTLGALKLPTKNGWIVVRDYMDGVPGNVLGAARYSASEGLMPTNVELMRDTVAGSSYQVVFFTNNGDTGFSLADDKVIDGIATAFKAN